MAAAFQILSDLHLETHSSYKYNFKRTASNLALLGDIGQVVDDGLFAFLESQLKRYWNVFFLLGNHEPIGTSWTTVKDRVRAFAARMEELRARSTMGRFVFLDQTRYDVNDTLTVLGCTLFSKVQSDQVPAVGSRLIDFSGRINQWTVQDHVDMHMSDLDWLNKEILDISTKEPTRQIAVFTHHSPTLDQRATNPHHVGSAVTSGFATDLSIEGCWTNESVVLWAFGHTHYNCDFQEHRGAKRLVTNQKGYSGAPQVAFDAEKVHYIGKFTDSGMLG